MPAQHPCPYQNASSPWAHALPPAGKRTARQSAQGLVTLRRLDFHLQAAPARSRLADLVDVDVAVSGTRKERVAVRAPSERDTPRDAALQRRLGEELLQDVLVLEVPHLDGVVRGRAQPVVLRAEGQSVDGAAGVERVQVLAVVHVPQHRGAILTT